MAQAEWNRRFIYDPDYALNDQIRGGSKGEVAAKIINTSSGICNISATGFALLLRAIGIPSRVCAGYWKQSEDYGGRHMWVEYWSGDTWVPHEDQVGILGAIDEKGALAEVLQGLKHRVSQATEQRDELQNLAEELLIAQEKAESEHAAETFRLNAELGTLGGQIADTKEALRSARKKLQESPWLTTRAKVQQLLKEVLDEKD